ncbi:hypothetical protein V6N00_12880 [Tersicoccus sp. MR15.9]|uniref:hypothetical protein n=1 Tax=Tersicoccus mangrovi TaxID=3121635 RepID=UPI002FE58FF0
MAWIETVAGTLVQDVTHIAVVHQDRQSDPWEVTVSASSAPASFATGLESRTVARALQRRLAAAITTADTAPVPMLITFEDATGELVLEPLAAPVGTPAA